jgi:phospholipid transport system substrate-binding protein
METLIRQWAWCVILVLLVLAQGGAAQEEGSAERAGRKQVSPAGDANDPNELWWRKWDASVRDPNDPNELLEAKWNAVLKILQAKDVEQKIKERIIDKVVSPLFDFPLMGRLALGRTHWPKLDAAQREKFIKLFVVRLKALYLKKTALYTNQEFSLKRGVQRRNTIRIPMLLTSDDREIAILYKLRRLDEPDKADERWKIYDVEIQGVSILLTYRSQFDDILRRGSVQDLLAQLEKPPSQ